MGLQLPLGELNKLAELVKAEAKKDINMAEANIKANDAIDSLTEIATE